MVCLFPRARAMTPYGIDLNVSVNLLSPAPGTFRPQLRVRGGETQTREKQMPVAKTEIFP